MVDFVNGSSSGGVGIVPPFISSRDFEFDFLGEKAQAAGRTAASADFGAGADYSSFGIAGGAMVAHSAAPSCSTPLPTARGSM